MEPSEIKWSKKIYWTNSMYTDRFHAAPVSFAEHWEAVGEEVSDEEDGVEGCQEDQQALQQRTQVQLGPGQNDDGEEVAKDSAKGQ